MSWSHTIHTSQRNVGTKVKVCSHLIRSDMRVNASVSFLQKALSDCPHSVTYFGSAINRLGKDVYEVLILMQLYAGQTVMFMLQQHMTQGRKMPESLVMKIFTDVCLAVARLHHRTKPITHRDLKVENILQDFSKNFVLCDFGSCTTSVMAPLDQGVADCEEQIQRFTTLAYRSPEMIDLYSGFSIHTKSDIWVRDCTISIIIVQQ